MKFIINKDLWYVVNYIRGKIYEAVGSYEGRIVSFRNESNSIQHVLKSDIIEVCFDTYKDIKPDTLLPTNGIKIKYFDPDLPKLVLIEKGDCIDLRVSKVYVVGPNGKESREFPLNYHKGDTLFFKLGVGMKLPKGYKANVYPRSSTFKNYGFILTNSVGIIDNSYSGNEDEWSSMMYCTRDGVIDYGDRILQFEPVPVYTHNFIYDVVDNLDDNSRGGYGSTGVK